MRGARGEPGSPAADREGLLLLLRGEKPLLQPGLPLKNLDILTYFSWAFFNKLAVGGFKNSLEPVMSSVGVHISPAFGRRHPPPPASSLVDFLLLASSLLFPE